MTQTSLAPARAAGANGPLPGKVRVVFSYMTGLKREIFGNARLKGSWDRDGAYSGQWSMTPMEEFVGEDGCPAFRAEVDLDATQEGWTFSWGVLLDGPGGKDQWGITTEVRDHSATELHRQFVLGAPGGPPQRERYYLVQSRRLGAQKHRPEGASRETIRFAVWAPNAKDVQVVMGKIWDVDDPSKAPLEKPLLVQKISGGYVDNEGGGARTDLGPFPMIEEGDGVWVTDAARSPELEDFARFDHRPYMFRIEKDNGEIAYRTDLYSRCQIGSGKTDPGGRPFEGRIGDLDGSVSCSVVVDPDKVTTHFEEPNGVWPEPDFVDTDTFWSDEDRRIGDAGPVPKRVDDLVIYEAHIGALGKPGVAGTLKDAIELLDYLVDLGVNAIELLPLSEFGGEENWGYATSHYFAIEYSGGGRDKFKSFIKECHRRGIAVIFDVVYNHFTHNGDRAEWLYDTGDHARNAYYWYEGSPDDYSAFDRAVGEGQRGHGGYVDNMSTNYAPRYHEELVRGMFVSSAVMMVEEFHIDGFRFDQTTSIHAYNVLHADGRPVPRANAFGAKLLREVARTLKLIKPEVILTAEDHSTWDKVTEPTSAGGLGFDAAWYADFYHHLIGDTDKGSDYAKLIKTAGLGDDRALTMGYFAGVLAASGGNRVVYSESHDEAGNAHGTKRTIVVAANGAPLVGETRRYAEARCRFAFGVTVLSAGTPMFLFGEEVGAQEDFLYNRIFNSKIDLVGGRQGNGKNLFAFYRDAIQLRLGHPGLRGRLIDVLHVHDLNRVLAWRRWGEGQDFLILASLNNRPYRDGYTISSPRLPDGRWKEIFNSDSSRYGGGDFGNGGAEIPAGGGSLNAVIPANGLIVLRRA